MSCAEQQPDCPHKTICLLFVRGAPWWSMLPRLTNVDWNDPPLPYGHLIVYRRNSVDAIVLISLSVPNSLDYFFCLLFLNTSQAVSMEFATLFQPDFVDKSFSPP